MTHPLVEQVRFARGGSPATASVPVASRRAGIECGSKCVVRHRAMLGNGGGSPRPHLLDRTVGPFGFRPCRLEDQRRREALTWVRSGNGSSPAR